MEEKKMSESEKEILNELNVFIKKMDNAYKTRYGTAEINFRNCILTDSKTAYIFFFIYMNCSKYYKSNTEEDTVINKKISEQLQNIIFEMYIIFEFEIFDENFLFKYETENEYEMLYNLNKTQNLIVKTRILWEKVMNFTYLIIERKELKDSKSKKKKFKKWCEEKEIIFFDEVLSKLEAFDSIFRTGEVHEYSKLKQYFIKDKNQNISLYCLDLLFKFSNETIFNILAYITDQEPNYKMWQKLPDDITESIKEFTKVPEWVTQYSKEKNIDITKDGMVIKNFEIDNM